MKWRDCVVIDEELLRGIGHCINENALKRDIKLRS